jgi:HEAT repeat protein
VILDALVRIGPGATPLLMRVARTHPKMDARRVAVRSLGAIGGAAARDSLLELLDTPERDMVTQALGAVGDPATWQVIRGLLDDACVDVRRQAVIALGKTMGVRAAGRLVDGLMDPHHSVRFAAAGAIESLGPEGAGVLLERLDGLSGPSRYLAVRTLGRLRHEPAADTLARLLADDDWGIRAAAAEALGRLDTDVSRPALEEALRVEKHPFVRERIQISLQSSGAR